MSDEDTGARVRVACGSDHAGFDLKEKLRKIVSHAGYIVEDLGCHSKESCDYPDFAHEGAIGVVAGRFRFAVLVCGTGVGMAMAANRHTGVRAVVCSEAYSARMAREHNNANVLCLGARVVGAGLAEDIVTAFLGATFEGGRHGTRVEKIEHAPAHR
jgi:ribose 5-phosphate isomerase B